MNDPEFEKRTQEMFARAQKMDVLILSTLKTHLLVEQTMDGYLTASGKRQWMRKRFSDKMKKCKLLAKGEDRDNPLWDVLDAGNCLRNTVAHTLEIARIKEKMAVLKEKFFAILTQEQVDSLKDQPDDFVAMSAFSTCAGFIATLQARLSGTPAS